MILWCRIFLYLINNINRCRTITLAVLRRLTRLRQVPEKDEVLTQEAGWGCRVIVQPVCTPAGTIHLHSCIFFAIVYDCTLATPAGAREIAQFGYLARDPREIIRVPELRIWAWIHLHAIHNIARYSPIAHKWLVRRSKVTEEDKGSVAMYTR